MFWLLSSLHLFNVSRYLPIACMKDYTVKKTREGDGHSIVGDGSDADEQYRYLCR